MPIPIRQFPTLSVIVPVYRSEKTLKELVSRLTSVCAELGSEYEILLVNDGSPDTSWKVITELSSQYPQLRGLSLMRNFGQHNALLCGIREAKFDVVITLDDDLQNPPEEIPKLLHKLNAGYDVVYGTREKEQHGFARDMASQITKWALTSTMGVECAKNVSAYRAFRTSLREAFKEYHNTFVNIDVLLTWGTNKFASEKVKHEERKEGQSNYNYRKLIVHALNMITGFTTLPLQIASLMGFAFTAVGGVTLSFVLIRWVVSGSVVPGFAFLASIICIFSGAQFFALGIIGEYMARMYFKTLNKPCYVLKHTTASLKRAA